MAAIKETGGGVMNGGTVFCRKYQSGFVASREDRRGAGAPSQNVTVVTGPGDLVTEILMHCVMRAQKMKRTPSTYAKCVFAQTTGGG